MRESVVRTVAALRRPLRELALLSSRCLAIAIAFAGAASAAEPFAAPKAAESAPATSAGGLAQVTLSLVVVLAAIFAAAWVVRRLRNFGRLGAGAIEVVADIAVGTKERAVLVQVGNQQILLGVAPGRVNTLHVLAEPVRPLPNPPPGTGGGDRSFRAFFSSHGLAAERGGKSFFSSPPPVVGGGQGGGAPDFKAILKRSLGL